MALADGQSHQRLEIHRFEPRLALEESFFLLATFLALAEQLPRDLGGLLGHGLDGEILRLVSETPDRQMRLDFPGQTDEHLGECILERRQLLREIHLFFQEHGAGCLVCDDEVVALLRVPCTHVLPGSAERPVFSRGRHITTGDHGDLGSGLGVDVEPLPLTICLATELSHDLPLCCDVAVLLSKIGLLLGRFAELEVIFPPLPADLRNVRIEARYNVLRLLVGSLRKRTLRKRTDGGCERLDVLGGSCGGTAVPRTCGPRPRRCRSRLGRTGSRFQCQRELPWR